MQAAATDVRFSYSVPWANEVRLRGSWDEWRDAVNLTKDVRGIWTCVLSLLPGRYTFKYVVDGVYKHDEGAPHIVESGNTNSSILILISPSLTLTRACRRRRRHRQQSFTRPPSAGNVLQHPLRQPAGRRSHLEESAGRRGFYDRLCQAAFLLT